ncbi:MAG: hypothetical protein ACR2L2_00945 [Acidobacteriota bacterium]
MVDKRDDKVFCSVVIVAWMNFQSRDILWDQVVSVLVVFLVLQLGLSASLSAQQQPQLISTSEMRAAIQSQSRDRADRVREITRSLGRVELISQVSRLGGMRKVETALGTLDDETLQNLSQQCRRAEKDFSGGLKTGYWVLIGVVAFLAVVLVVNLVHDNS